MAASQGHQAGDDETSSKSNTSCRTMGCDKPRSDQSDYCHEHRDDSTRRFMASVAYAKRTDGIVNHEDFGHAVISEIGGLENMAFAECDFAHTEIFNENLAGTSFKECDFEASYFIRTSLVGAELENCNLSDSLFFECDLTKAQIKGAKIDRARLRGAVFTGAAFERASFKKLDIVGASFRDAELSEIVFRECDLSFVDFSGAELNRVHVRGDCTVRKMRLRESQIKEGRIAFEPQPSRIADVSILITSTSPHKGPEESGTSADGAGVESDAPVNSGGQERVVEVTLDWVIQNQPSTVMREFQLERHKLKERARFVWAPRLLANLALSALSMGALVACSRAVITGTQVTWWSTIALVSAIAVPIFLLTLPAYLKGRCRREWIWPSVS